VELREIEVRAGRHAALGDPIRLTIVDELVVADRSPVELQQLVGIGSNLLAHHLDVLEAVGLISRTRSSGDGRRRYVHLHREALGDLRPGRPITAGPVLFVCTQNSARSQLAAALWRHATDAPAASAGTHPADRVHRGAVAAARRAGLDLADARPQHLEDVADRPALVVTVCDRAHEELTPADTWLHWSIPDPVPVGTASAFDATVAELRARIEALVEQGAA
jgi:protein-tyrosine-phosphatase/DNA-binding transcriptional ArsR family regulator